jgi:hypothetical protein
MKLQAKIICGGIALAWLQVATAGDVAVSDQAGTIVLESVSAPADAAQVQLQAASAPAGTQDGGAQARVPVKPYYDKVDRARIEKRISDRAARTKKRSVEAEKDAATRAAKTQQ